VIITPKVKKRAQDKVTHAIASGELVRPATCGKCGKAPRSITGKIHAHHPDYSKPLEVEWLCATCHRAQHPYGGKATWPKKAIPEDIPPILDRLRELMKLPCLLRCLAREIGISPTGLKKLLETNATPYAPTVRKLRRWSKSGKVSTLRAHVEAEAKEARRAAMET